MKPAVIALALLACSAAMSTRAGAAGLPCWSFEEEADFEGWQHADFAAPPTVSDGALRFTTGRRDPILLSPRVRLATSPYQRVEVRLGSSSPGTAELFWAPTLEGPNGGFDQGRSLRFHVSAGPPRDYVLYPFWHTDRQIVRLRLDPPYDAQVALYALRVTDLAPPRAGTTNWDFARDRSLGGWMPAQGLEPPVLAADGLETRATGDAPLVLSPRLDLEAGGACWVTLRMRAPGEYGEVWAITDQPPGVVKQPFTFAHAAGAARWRTYNLPLSFAGRLLGLALLPTRDGSQPLVIASVGVGSAPAGPASLREVCTYLDDPLPRVGRAADLVCVVTNSGGERARHLSASLQAPEGMDLLAPARQAGPESLPFGERHAFRWPVAARRPVNGRVEVQVSAGCGDSCVCATGLLVTPAPAALPAADYVPEPVPARGPYKIGMYYFPGWNDATRWDPIRSAGFPRPVLGYYREGDPEIADWHIKWAVEHGVDFFIYDWYWIRGNQMLTHGLDAYFKSRYHDRLKFCLLWANHNPPGTSSEADLLAVTRFWIEDYFRRPEYKTVEGKPLVAIFAPGSLREDMGSAAVRAAFDTMRALCREAGLGGLYLVACAGTPGELPLLAQEGYDAASAYTYPAAGAQGRLWAPYDAMVTGFEETWRAMRAAGDLPYLLPLAPGWDNRPWAGDRALVRHDSTPDSFREMCRRAKRLMDESQGIESRMLFVEAWNEWGEGAYAEPAGRWQFGYLDALREVFTEAPRAHLDLGPRDVGLGPYDVAWPEPRSAWEFDRDGDLEGWTRSAELADLEVRDGSLCTTALGGDPAFLSPPVRLDASRYRRVAVRMRVSRAAMAQLFWSTEHFATSEATSVRFTTFADGEFRTYTLEVGANPTWLGTVRSLRFDPTCGGDAAGTLVEVDFVRVLP